MDIALKTGNRFQPEDSESSALRPSAEITKMVVYVWAISDLASCHIEVPFLSFSN